MVANGFDKKVAEKFKNDPLAMRVYTSKLLGKDKNLVLHGGGNTSVKIGNYLYVKGSGWDLGSIEKEGFPAVNLKTLKEMVTRKSLSDSEMVKKQREAMKDKSYPNPSVEAILHAVIPFKFVDHTHADAVVTITNTPRGKEFIKKIYGDEVLIIDYVMPGFILAKEIYEKTKNFDWSEIKGMILLNHGVFTFGDDAEESYANMIEIVNKAERFLEEKAPLKIKEQKYPKIEKEEIEKLKKSVSSLRKEEIKPQILDEKEAFFFASLPNVEDLVKKGPLTPEHVIRTKPFPLIIKGEIEKETENFKNEYEKYFKKFATNEIMLDPAPRWGIYKNRGVLIFGKNEKENLILKDIISHTVRAILKAEKIGGWKSLNQEEIFKMEYWELEQAKLKK